MNVHFVISFHFDLNKLPPEATIVITHTPKTMGDQQHFAIFSPSNLLDDVEMFLDLQLTDTLRRQLHQLIDEAPFSETQLNHLLPKT